MLYDYMKPRAFFKRTFEGAKYLKTASRRHFSALTASYSIFPKTCQIHRYSPTWRECLIWCAGCRMCGMGKFLKKVVILLKYLSREMKKPRTFPGRCDYFISTEFKNALTISSPCLVITIFMFISFLSVELFSIW